MNDQSSDAMGLEGPSRTTIVRAAACALFVGMLLGIGASAIAHPGLSTGKAAARATYDTDQSRITQAAAPIPRF